MGEKDFEEFWDEFGKDNVVSKWGDTATGRKVIQFFESGVNPKFASKNDSKYNKCRNKFLEFKNGKSGDKTGEESAEALDINQVDKNRIQTLYDISFFVAIDDMPRFLVSNINYHTGKWVVGELDKQSPFKLLDEIKKERGKEQTNKSQNEQDSQGGEIKKEKPITNKKKNRLLQFILPKVPKSEKYMVDERNLTPEELAEKRAVEAQTAKGPTQGEKSEDGVVLD